MYTRRLLCWTIRGSIPGRGKNVMPSPKRPDRLWGPPNPLFAWVLKIFPEGGVEKVDKPAGK